MRVRPRRMSKPIRNGASRLPSKTQGRPTPQGRGTRHLYLDALLQIFSLTVSDQGLVVVAGYIKLCGL
jgi:hypothetical protein